MVCAVVLGIGIVQGWFGRVDYAGDAISYLDLSKAVARGDWGNAVSPYWSFGYPVLLAVARPIFPAGFAGEWTSIHVLNLVLYAAAYASFIQLLSVAMAFAARVGGIEKPGDRESVFLVGSAIFLLYEIEFRCVSRIGPDQTVNLLYLLSTSAALHFCLQPKAKTAIVLGLLLGLGYMAKAAFLPISLLFVLTLLLHTLLRRSPGRRPALLKLAWVVPALAFVTVPYVLALSHGAGKWTLGESGALNYAWNVNGLPAFLHWQGSSPYGAPIHGNLVGKNPPVFTFAEPFHVTYPPWYEPFYWYEGYRHYFNLHNQIEALKKNVSVMFQLLVKGPHMAVKILAWMMGILVAVFFLADLRAWLKRLGVLWPLYLPAFATMAMYLIVVMESRYVTGPVLVILTAPLLVLYTPTRLMGRWAGYGLVAVIVGWSALCIGKDQQDAFRRAARCEPYNDSDDWKVALFLISSGVQPGEKVAAVETYRFDATACSWAYISGVHIVAEIGNDAYDPSEGQRDFDSFNGNPDVQNAVFALFRKAGARLVIVREVTGQIRGTAWQRVPGTQWWIHRV